MTISDAIEHFGNQTNLAKALENCSPQAVQQWVAKGEIPRGRQYEIEVITSGNLKADPKKTA